MKARGRTKDILKKVYVIHGLVGVADNDLRSDMNTDGPENGHKKLKEALELLQEIVDMYDPL